MSVHSNAKIDPIARIALKFSQLTSYASQASPATARVQPSNFTMMPSNLLPMPGHIRFHPQARLLLVIPDLLIRLLLQNLFFPFVILNLLQHLPIQLYPGVRIGQLHMLIDDLLLNEERLGRVSH